MRRNCNILQKMRQQANILIPEVLASLPAGLSARRFLLVVSIVVAPLAAACGGGASDDPVATVTVQLDREVVPLGGPVNLAVQFVVAPTHVPLDEDYRVMVHFLDSDGEMMWAADHDPPTPTSQWQPGQTISYTHRLRIPMYPYIGEAQVVVGLYSATTGQRLVLAGEDLGQRAYHGTVIALEPQPESSFLMYREGWHDDEFNQDANERWRWTSEQASLSFRNPGAEAVLYLEFDGRFDLFDPPQEVTVSLGEEVLHSAAVGSDERQFLEINLPLSLLGESETVTVDIQVDRTFVPSAVPGAGPGDDRTLGIRVFYAFLEPR